MGGGIRRSLRVPHRSLPAFRSREYCRSGTDPHGRRCTAGSAGIHTGMIMPAMRCSDPFPGGVRARAGSPGRDTGKEERRRRRCSGIAGSPCRKADRFLPDRMHPFRPEFFLRAPPGRQGVLHLLYMRSPAGKKCNFAKYKSPEYLDSEQSGRYMNNCAFHDGTLR